MIFGGKVPESLGECDLCKKGRYTLKEAKIIGGTEYKILKCDKCSHEVARSAS